MSMTDPIADFLSRIRNGIQARKSTVDCPRSGLKLRIAEILRDEGFLDGVSSPEEGYGGQGTLSVTLRYDNANHNAITGLRRASRPGQRRYVGSKGLPRVRNGLGIAIVSTSRGVMTDRQAREMGVGGEVLCEVW
jgi:small subunit ribosomal protein S8